jgi:HEAT repeat protein
MLAAAMQNEIQNTIPDIVKRLQDYDAPVRQAAITGLSALAMQRRHANCFPVQFSPTLSAAMQGRIQEAIPGIVDRLKHNSAAFRQAAIAAILALSAHGAYDGCFLFMFFHHACS